MLLLDHPEAVSVCQERLTAFLARYLPLFYTGRAATRRRTGHPRPTQRPRAQDPRADGHRRQRALQADPVPCDTINVMGPL